MSSMPQDLAGKIAMARALKDEGNELFKQQNFKKAKSKYSTALAFTKGLPGRSSNLKDTNEPMAALAMQGGSVNSVKLTAEENEMCDELDAIIKTNIATCCLKLGKLTEALEKAKDAKSHLPSHWKADLRLAEALLMLKKGEAAIQVLNELAELPQLQEDKAALLSIKKLKESCQKSLKEEENKQKKAFGNIFTRFREENNGIGYAESVPKTRIVGEYEERKEAEEDREGGQGKTIDVKALREGGGDIGQVLQSQQQAQQQAAQGKGKAKR